MYKRVEYGLKLYIPMSRAGTRMYIQAQMGTACTLILQCKCMKKTFPTFFRGRVGVARLIDRGNRGPRSDREGLRILRPAPGRTGERSAVWRSAPERANEETGLQESCKAGLSGEVSRQKRPRYNAGALTS